MSSYIIPIMRDEGSNTEQNNKSYSSIKFAVRYQAAGKGCVIVSVLEVQS